MVPEGYEKIKTVGKGAFGTAVLYRKLLSGTLVVMKEVNMLELTAAERDMALNEVQVLSSLRHPNIIQYLGSFQADGVLMIEMEYADAGTLAQLIASTSRMSEKQVLSLFVQCASAIQYMHQNNILHRDLKTANVFLTKENLIKVGDFGIAKIMSTVGQAHTLLGTPYYISPEMCEGKQYDTKSDVWALGCILYEMACLQKTFQGENLPALVNKIMKGSFDPIPIVYSKGLRNLVADILQKDPNLRPSAAEVHERSRLLLNQSERTSASRVRSVLYQVSGSGPSFSCVPVPLPPLLRITQVAVSRTHYVAAADCGTVFSWGQGSRGQLGHPEPTVWLQHPTPVQALAETHTVAVGAGEGFSVFLSDSGVVSTCGEGMFGTERLGVVQEEVRQVECGDHHCVTLTCSGHVYAWGRGDSGQLGTGLQSDFHEPTKVPIDTTDKVKSIHCGPDCTAVITQNGTVYACGSNRHNKLGLSHSLLRRFGFKTAQPEKYLKLQMVKSVQSWQIVKISLAANHSAALTDCGRIVTMGSDAHEVPSVVAAVEDKIATDVACGATFTVMSTTHNALYSWGSQSPHAQEILALYASPSQISRGETVVLNSVVPLQDSIIVLVDTTVPLVKQVAEFDTVGPIPDWITSEWDLLTH